MGSAPRRKIIRCGNGLGPVMLEMGLYTGRPSTRGCLRWVGANLQQFIVPARLTGLIGDGPLNVVA